MGNKESNNEETVCGICYEGTRYCSVPTAVFFCQCHRVNAELLYFCGCSMPFHTKCVASWQSNKCPQCGKKYTEKIHRASFAEVIAIAMAILWTLLALHACFIGVCIALAPLYNNEGSRADAFFWRPVGMLGFCFVLISALKAAANPEIAEDPELWRIWGSYFLITWLVPWKIYILLGATIHGASGVYFALELIKDKKFGCLMVQGYRKRKEVK